MRRAGWRGARGLGTTLFFFVLMFWLSQRADAQGVPGLRIIELKVEVRTTEVEDDSTGTRKGTGETEVTVANDSPDDVDVSLEVLGPTAGETTAMVSVTSETCLVPALDVAKCVVSVETMAPDDVFVGQLVARADGLAPAAVALTVAPNRELETPGWLVIGGSLFLAVALMLVRVVAFPIPKLTRRAKMGPVNMKFADSWASSLTAVGAILGTVLAAKVLPESGRYISDARFTALNLLFGALVVFAPFVYAAIRIPDRVTAAAPDKDAPYLGFAVVFIVSSTITVWAVIGELGTLFIAVLEIANGPVGLSDVVVVLLTLFLVAAVVLTFVYTFITVGWQIEAKTVSEEKTARVLELRKLAPDSISDAESVELQDLAEELQASAAASSWTPL